MTRDEARAHLDSHHYRMRCSCAVHENERWTFDPRCAAAFAIVNGDVADA